VTESATTETAEEFIDRKEAEPGGREIEMSGVRLRLEQSSCVDEPGYPDFVAVIERWRRVHDGGVEYRLCYYVHNAIGRWGFANRPLVITAGDFDRLLKRARDQGTIESEPTGPWPESATPGNGKSNSGQGIP
jgi:hypothetical protein